MDWIIIHKIVFTLIKPTGTEDVLWNKRRVVQNLVYKTKEID